MQGQLVTIRERSYRAVSRLAGGSETCLSPAACYREAHNSPQVRGRAWLTTGSPQTKRNYAVLGGTVAMMAIRPADQGQCG